MPSSHDPWIVAASLFIAVFASYVTLDLARRVTSQEVRRARWWWLGGSIAMGTGIWAMHFVAMLAFETPIAIGYLPWTTLLSWVAGVTASGIGLYVAASRQLTPIRLAVGSVAMATGVCTMHYVGIAAIDLAPGIVWNWPLVAASVAVAWGASAAALVIFSWLNRPMRHRWARQLLASALMGAAISGMHYTGMAAAGIELGAVCLSASELVGKDVGVLVILASLAILGLTLVTSVLDAQMQARGARMSKSLRIANSQLQRVNDEMQRRTLLDPLTFLPNRLSFEKRLEQALASGRESPSLQTGDGLGVLFIGLDGFRAVNEIHGYAVGDEVLKEAARRLRSTAQRRDLVARIGSDEFVLILERPSGEGSLHEAAEGLRASLATPFRFADAQIELTASCGLVEWAGCGRAEDLMSQASAAMVRAKCAGGDRLKVHGDRHKVSADAPAMRPELQAGLMQAIAREEMQLACEPHVDLASNELGGVKASLRWRHPVMGQVAPDVFLPLADRLGLRAVLDLWGIDEACRHIRLRMKRGPRARWTIEVAASTLAQDGLATRLRSTLERHKVDPSQLLLGVSESLAMDDGRAVKRNVEALAGMGVFLSLERYGTGPSSLMRLRQLPLRQVRIDRTLIRDLESSADACAVVEGLINAARAIGVSIVADGVETLGQREILMELRCNEVQGPVVSLPDMATDPAARHGAAPRERGMEASTQGARQADGELV